MLLSELTSNFEGYETYSTDIWKVMNKNEMFQIETAE